MPTTGRDARLLAACLLLVSAGVALVAVGVVLDPPMALLRRLTK